MTLQIRAILAVALLFLVSLAGRADAAQPNVLFIAIDDLRDELGCYGLPYVQSPHMDKLAEQSVLFTNHFVQVPTCGSSRYALLTGRSPINSGAMGNASMYGGSTALNRQQTDGAQSFPELFRRSGYHTICIGKMSHTPDGRIYAYNGSGDGRVEVPHAWDELPTPFGPWKRGWGTFFAYEGGRHREDGKGNRDLMEFVAEKDTDLPDGLMAETAIEKLAEMKKQDKPFFLGLGFFKPHLPFVATKGDWDAFADSDIPLPEHGSKPSSKYWHGSGEFYKYAAPHPKTNPLAEQDQINSRRAYLACVRYTDRQVGKVLTALQELELDESTIVVIWGDHGWHLGDSALWGKHTPFDRALRSTLMIHVPGGKQAGTQCDALVETLDLYPTLIDLCQPKFEKTEHPLDGHSLQPLLTGERDSVRDVAISYWKGAASVRSSKFRLIARTGSTDVSKLELYDVSQGADPLENVAAKHPDVVKELLNHAAQAKRGK